MQQRRLMPWAWILAGGSAFVALVVVLSIGSATIAQQPADPMPVEPERRPPTAEELKNAVVDRADYVLVKLRRAFGEDTCRECHLDFARNVRDVRDMMCSKYIGPEFFSSPAYDVRIHEPLASALLRTCDRLKSTAGPPEDTASWRFVALEAKQELEVAFAAEASKPR